MCEGHPISVEDCLKKEMLKANRLQAGDKLNELTVNFALLNQHETFKSFGNGGKRHNAKHNTTYKACNNRSAERNKTKCQYTKDR